MISAVEQAVKKRCGWCGEIKEAYGYQEKDFAEVKDHIEFIKTDLLVEGRKPVRDDDVVGVPICKECFKAIRGVNEK